MKTINKTETFTGRVHEGHHEMQISTDEGCLIGLGTVVSNIADEFSGRRAKITIAVEIEEIP